MYNEFPIKDTIKRNKNFDTEYITHLTQIRYLKIDDQNETIDIMTTKHNQTIRDWNETINNTGDFP